MFWKSFEANNSSYASKVLSNESIVNANSFWSPFKVNVRKEDFEIITNCNFYLWLLEPKLVKRKNKMRIESCRIRHRLT